jgi:hypothetical protein
MAPLSWNLTLHLSSDSIITIVSMGILTKVRGINRRICAAALPQLAPLSEENKYRNSKKS